MTLVGLALNLLLVVLLGAALMMGLRLNRRLKGLRDSHESFAVAVRELNAAAERAEQGLADLRAATDEAVETLADRIEKGRALSAKLERLIVDAPRALEMARESARTREPARPAREAEPVTETPRRLREAEPAVEPSSRMRELELALSGADESQARRLGALLAAAREARTRPERAPEPAPRAPERALAERPAPRRFTSDDDLFDDPPLRMGQGGR